jgi:hypothetical protein
LIVHLHASTWNEEKMLPFFFRHYDRIVDRYFIRDNYSTDGSLEILKQHPKVSVSQFTFKGDSIVLAGCEGENRIWKSSRGEADWVAVCNVDEFFWHPDLRWYLHECRRQGITFLRSTGFQMVSDEFPKADDDLPRTHTRGGNDPFFNKPAFFNPDAVVESRFGVARHSCDPLGRIVRPAVEEILLLHYKYLGRDYVVRRHAELGARRRAGDIEGNFGIHYEASRTERAFADWRRRARRVVPGPLGSLRRLCRRWLAGGIRAEPSRPDGRAGPGAG